jgi:structural maintenance of chromosome 4
MNNKTGFPSSSSRLFDLITPKNEAVKPAFYMALKETLVVRDLDTAVSIAYEGDRAKWRVVTEDGKK